ncbi:uncharacterized protein PV06_00326 [Exophiala oligosperma]|uniref:Amidohydrolase-related domain-containing protein n=2 Tax=Chaetothyriales TaxID=34395 RepID=A0A0D2CCK6_9EURO|nr:uncharacterized protein PV06_00326 [Exophiala oligosperma]KIW47652.1 hypothetical protein PV06_00326 [Exophiala oligosperma]
MSSAKQSTTFKGAGRIDVHHHCFPATVAELRSEFQDNKFGIAFTDFPVKPEEHIQYMDEVGVQTAVVTPSIKNEWHNRFTKDQFLQLCEDSLKAQLEYVSYNPLRFGCFAILPLPHIEETLAFIKKTSILPLPPDGWGVTTAMGEKYLGDPAFEPVWAELARQGSVVFVHPADTVMPPGIPFGPFVQEFPFDTCRAITTVISSGLLLRHPNVKFLFSHNGGAFPFLADRIGAQHIDEIIAKNNNGLRLREILSTKNIYFDTSISSSYQYPLLKELGVPHERLLYATDFPYTRRGDSTSCYLAGADAPRASGLFNDQEMEDIFRNNSLKLFPRLAKEYAKLQ